MGERHEEATRPMRIAIIGAGLFGCMAAIRLKRKGHDVHLMDMLPGIMLGATRSNQQRAHRGYHYPRSFETSTESLTDLDLFIDQWEKAIIPYPNRDQYYAIAREGSSTDVAGFIQHMMDLGLEHSPVELRMPMFNSSELAMAFRVRETFIDYDRLRDLVWMQIQKWGVNFIPIRNGMKMVDELRANYDHIVVACYASNNAMLKMLDLGQKPTQYELVEKPVVRLPKKYNRIGAVVMDGPFGCCDPWGTTGLHVMGHVHHAVHRTGETEKSVLGGEMPEGAFDLMRDDLGRFLPYVRDAEHLQSMWVVRAVLPDVDDTDERPTIVTRHDDQVISVFSGKLTACVRAAIEIEEVINAQQDERAKEASQG